MKIDGMKPLGRSAQSTGIVENGNGRKGPAAPKLLARAGEAAKLMPAESHANTAMAATASQARHMRWVPYEALCALGMATFPTADNPAEVRQANRLAASECGEIRNFDERPGDARITGERRRNVATYFTDTWPSRITQHQHGQLEQGSYLLMYGDGRSRPCNAYLDFVEFVGGGDTGDFPERILHVAGPQLHNFLCQTYLYNPVLSIFGHVGQRRVEPMPNLRSLFEVARNHDGRVQVRYAARDDYLDRAMLVGAAEYDEHEARTLAPASIHFSGTLLFSPDGACAVGPVQVRATAMQFAESVAARTADSFA